MEEGKLTPVPKALLVALLEDPPLLLRGDVLHAHWRLHTHNRGRQLDRRTLSSAKISHESSIESSRVAKAAGNNRQRHS